MIPFFVQIKCQLGKSYEVANKLADAEIASEIYSTAGDFDLLVKFYVDPSTDIGHFIAEKVQPIPGIAETRTIITFKAFGAGSIDGPGPLTPAAPCSRAPFRLANYQFFFFGGGVGPCTGGSVKM